VRSVIAHHRSGASGLQVAQLRTGTTGLHLAADRPETIGRVALAHIYAIASARLKGALDGGIGLWALAVLPADHPEGTNAAVKVVSLKRAPNVHDPLVSTFIVDYRPGGSAVLHRKPSAGYVLVYVLSGSIQAQAWSADVGVYRTGQTWVYPAFADNITSKNASTTEPARALVILVASDTDGSGPK